MILGAVVNSLTINLCKQSMQIKSQNIIVVVLNVCLFTRDFFLFFCKKAVKT